MHAWLHVLRAPWHGVYCSDAVPVPWGTVMWTAWFSWSTLLWAPVLHGTMGIGIHASMHACTRAYMHPGTELFTRRARRCLDHDPKKRPTATEVKEALKDMLEFYAQLRAQWACQAPL